MIWSSLCTTLHTLFPVFLFCHFQVNLFLHQSLMVFFILLLIFWSACDLLICFYSVSTACSFLFKMVFLISLVLLPWWMYLKKSFLTLLTVIYCKFIFFFLLFPVKIVYIFMHLFIARQVVLVWLLLNIFSESYCCKFFISISKNKLTRVNQNLQLQNLKLNPFFCCCHPNEIISAFLV